MKNSNVFTYMGGRLRDFARALYGNKVALMFIVLCAFGLCTTGRPVSYTVTEVFARFSRNTFIVLSLIIPVIAGLGLNFGIEWAPWPRRSPYSGRCTGALAVRRAF